MRIRGNYCSKEKNTIVPDSYLKALQTATEKGCEKIVRILREGHESHAIFASEKDEKEEI